MAGDEVEFALAGCLPVKHSKLAAFVWISHTAASVCDYAAGADETDVDGRWRLTWIAA